MMENDMVKNVFVMLCKTDGTILKILTDKVSLPKIKKGSKIFEFLVIPEVQRYWYDFVSLIYSDDDEMYWKSFISNINGSEYSFLIGRLDEDEVLIIGAQERIQQFLYKEIIKMNNELTNNIRSLHKKRSGSELDAYEELSKINNELSNARRELKKKNIQLEELNERLEELSIRDSLTGLYNRRYFFIILPKIIARAKRSKSPVSLVMIDINNFKMVNDTLGHDEGDNVLKYIAKCSNEIIRESQDTVFRFGGDEFLIILEKTDLISANLAMERLREKYEPNSRGTSLAMGIVCINPDDINEDFSDYLKFADELMYKNKMLMKKNS